jgi:hypothetical protein
MSGFGTDIVALACILGSAATSGAVTMAFLEGDPPAQADCAMEALSVSPNVVVSGGHGAHAIVMTTPRIHLQSARDCRLTVGEEVRIDLERARREMERARVRIEVARAGAEEAREAARMIRIQGSEARLLREEVSRQMKEAQALMEATLESANEARLEALAEALKGTEIQVDVVKKRSSGGQMD